MFSSFFTFIRIDDILENRNLVWCRDICACWCLLAGAQVDYCSSEPCMMHGTCISHTDHYQCICGARYSGSVCEIDRGKYILLLGEFRVRWYGRHIDFLSYNERNHMQIKYVISFILRIPYNNITIINTIIIVVVKLKP